MSEAASNELLGWIIRGVGLIWLIGAFVLAQAVRREATLDGMIAKLGEMTDEFVGKQKDPEEEAADAWSDRDDRRQRRWLGAQAILLGVTGLAMCVLSRWSVWLVAALIAGQGVYFLMREQASREAPTAEARREARPAQSTINAGWFSVAVGALIWLASSRNVLQ